MSTRKRKFDFNGSDTEYITFLESALSEKLNEPASLIPNPLHTSPSTPEPESLYSSHADTSPTSQTSYPATPRSTTESDKGPHNCMRIFHYDPIRNCDREEAPRIPSLEIKRTNEPQGLKELRGFVEEMSNNSLWSRKRERLNLSKPSTNRFIIETLCGRLYLKQHTEPKSYPDQLPEGKEALISRGCDYGALMYGNKMEAELMLHIVKYQKLIFVSLCVVMADTGTPLDTVDWMMRNFLSDSKPENLRRLRYGCVWVNRCLSSMLQSFWGFRSWEAFLLCQ